MPSSPKPYLNEPAHNGSDAIRAAGEAVDGLSMSTTDAIRVAVPIARKAADAVKRGSESLRWDMGRYTGMRVAKYQNWLYEQNRDWHFRDETLCVLWCVEFPEAKCDYPAHFDYIDVVRREYNRSGHKVDEPPQTPCIGYDHGASATSASTSVRRPGFFLIEPSKSTDVLNAPKSDSDVGGEGPTLLSVHDLADLRRKLTALLNSLDSASGAHGEGIRKRINRLSHDGGPIPRETAALMTTITEMRNSVEYESKVLSASECAVVRHAWQAIQEWARSVRRP